MYDDLPDAVVVKIKKRTGEDESTDASSFSLEKKRKILLVEADDEIVETQSQESKKVRSIQETLEKLSGYLVNDKKLPKASELFVQLMESECNEENGDLFFEVLSKLMENEERVHQKDLRAAFQHIFESIHEKHMKKFSAAQQNALNNWMFSAILHNQLFTDDTYQFVRAAKKIKQHIGEYLQRLPGKEKEKKGNEEDDDSEKKAIFSALRTLFSMRKLPWARVNIEEQFNVLTAHRLQFQGSTREQIDEWTAGLKRIETGENVSHSLASAQRKNIIQKGDSEAGVKVGKSNHPLHNIGR